MIFWRWIEIGDGGEWQIDRESGSASNRYENATYLNFMLVLDCSGSMKDGIREVKDNAKYFLRRMLQASDKGNVRVGIIGFNTVAYSKTHTLDPIPLTHGNIDRLNNFIESFDADGGTALYYSVNTATEKLQKDYEKNIKGKKFAGSAIIAFTDGMDNTSTDEMYNSSKRYIEYTMRYFPQQTVNGMDILSWCVGKRGEDITSDKIWNANVDQLEKVFDNFIPISQMYELRNEFDKIINNLIQRNTVLGLQVANGTSGRVGWTIPEYEDYRLPPPPKEPSNFWLGLGVEIGTSSYYDYYYDYSESSVAAALRVDAAWPISEKFALGGTLSLGYSEGDVVYKVGPLAKISFSNGTALLAGLGVNNWGDSDEAPVYFTLGWKFKSPWYINFSYSGLESYSVGIGYSICGGKNK